MSEEFLNIAAMLSDWKLKLRYGRLKMKFQHFTVLADGRSHNYLEDFGFGPGKAWMGMKAWAESTDEAADMISFISSKIGFEITGRIEVYETNPVSPPQDKPFGYDIQFTEYD